MVLILISGSFVTKKMAWVFLEKDFNERDKENSKYENKGSKEEEYIYDSDAKPIKMKRCETQINQTTKKNNRKTILAEVLSKN